jgi:choloylglycine hydrolase
MPGKCIACQMVVFLLFLCADTFGCSSVCLNKKGQLILGNNMDWISGDGLIVVNKRDVVKRGFWYENKPGWTWTSKYGSITLNTEGREFPIRGMNEKGLVIAEMMLTETQLPPSENLPVLSGSQWIQYQLDRCATIKEVIASQMIVRIESTDWSGMASHFLLCDSTGAVAGIEWLDGKMIVYSDSTFPVPAMVNSTYESCISSGDDPTGRFKAIADLYSAYDTAGTNDGVGYLFSMLDAARVINSLYFATKWSWAFDVHAKRFYWKTVVNEKIRYCDFNDFDFSCGTNAAVLDINSPDSGNVRHAFVPYTTAINRDLVTKMYATYNQYSAYLGKTYSDELIESIINFPDSTYCENTSNTKGCVQNPIQSECHISYNLKSLNVNIELTEKDNKRINVSVHDIQGRIVASDVVSRETASANIFIWKCPIVFARGIYLLKIVTHKKEFVQRVNVR